MTMGSSAMEKKYGNATQIVMLHCIVKIYRNGVPTKNLQKTELHNYVLFGQKDN
jgi:hypothetical protein